MAGDTGQGQNATIFSQSIPNVTRIDVNNTGDVISETTAEGVLRQVIGTGWEFTINFVAPTTATHTLEGAIKAGLSGAIDIESGKTKYTSSSGRSGGFQKSAPSNGFITYALTVTVDDDPTLAAAS
jgi:hypothetical protein